MDIIEALQEAKKGKRVRRPGWDSAITYSDSRGFYWIDVASDVPSEFKYPLLMKDYNSKD